MIPKQQIVHLPVYQPGKPLEQVKRELGLTEVIKLASNENPFGCSPRAIEALQAEVANISIYPDSFATELTSLVAQHFQVATNQVIFGAGSDEVILMMARAYFVPGDETVMASTTFPQYKHNAEIEGAKIVEVPLTADGSHDLTAMLAAINERTKIVWVCNPNNPTGNVLPRDELAKFVADVPKHVIVVLDEAYIEYVAPEKAPDSLGLLQKHENVVLLRTFSKIYGLASLRIGFGLGHANVIKNINQAREPFNTTRMAQAAAAASLTDPTWVATCKQRNDEGLAYLRGEFDRLGLSYFDPNGNFVMVDCGMDSLQVFEGLQRRGIIARAGWKAYPTHVRITVGSREQNEKFIAALEAVLKGA